MRTRKLGMLLVGAALALGPTLTFAQEAPTGSDATFGGGPPTQVGSGGMDACGNPLTANLTESGGTPGAPVVNPLGTTPMNNGVNPDIPIMLNMSQVRGTVVHAEGTLLLVQQPTEAAAGTDNPGPSGNRAVIQLPANCTAASFNVGQHVTAVGTPTEAGVLDANSVQAE